jgi:hypothetical protein
MNDLRQIRDARARLAAAADHVGQGAEREGRSRYTSEEEDRLAGIFDAWCRTLEQEKTFVEAGTARMPYAAGATPARSGG